MSVQQQTPAASVPKVNSTVLQKPSVSLLDEVGKLAHTAPLVGAKAWKREIAGGHPAPARAALLHLWLGEWALAHDQQPEIACQHFRTVQHLTGRADALHGLAAYDSAEALYYEGAYQDAADAFSSLLRPRTASAGYDPRSVSLWLRHADACADYHVEHARLGIPEPPRLDPECGIASLAACLRALGRPYDRKTLLAACRVTGEGSTLAELVASSRNLGVSVRAVAADETGLRALPKPLVAFTEKDHFVAVVAATKTHVSYLCSDCGPWPGGRVDLTWQQWRALSPGIYAAVTLPGSVPDRTVAALTSGAGQPAPVRLSYGGALSGLHLSSRLQMLTDYSKLRGHVFNYGNTTWLGCGFGISGLHCWPQCCPKDGPGHGGKNPGGGKQPQDVGPSGGDPVNLATGEEEYTPTPDLTVYNPTGPSVTWSRLYNSLRPYTYNTFQSPDFGTGWSQPYNVQFYGPPATGSILQIQQGHGYGPVNGVGHDAPAAGDTWDVLLNGSSVATSTAPNGWAFTFSAYSGTLTPPANAQVTTGYEVRWVASGYPQPGTNTNYSSPFDVVPASSFAQGGSASFAATGQDAPAMGLSWDIVQGSTTIASSASPNGYTVSVSGQGPASVSVATQATAPVGTFEARVRYSPQQGGTAYASATFTVYAAHTLYGGGSGSLVGPNGAVMAFTAPSAPSASTPVVACSVPPGYPCTVQWDYDPGYYSGYFVVTWADRTKWLTTPHINYQESGYLLGQIVDRNGNAINFQYYDAAGYALLLTGIADAAGNPLLTISRAGSGAITSVSDRYGRSVYYGTDTGGSGALGQVSQVVPTGTGNALTQYNRYTYSYANVSNPEGESGFYLLHTIQAPSPTGSGTSTATINYSNGSFAVSIIMDGNGNTRTYTPVSGSNSTQVTVSHGSSTVYTYVASFDSNMNGTGTQVLGTTGAVLSRTSTAFSDQYDPYRPSSMIDGDGNTWSYTWDQYGNMLTETPPAQSRGTTGSGVTSSRTPAVTTNTYSYAKFALGELTSTQMGSKSPTTFTYDDQAVTGGYAGSGLVTSVTAPLPGTAGSTSTGDDELHLRLDHLQQLGYRYAPGFG